MAVINVDDIYILDNTGQQVDDAVDYGLFNSNDNLLDNWYFVGGGSQLGDGVFPINQRGQTSYGASMYGIDRWRTWGNLTVELTADGLSLTSTEGSGLFQYPQQNRVLNLVGEQVTFSVKINGQIYSATGEIYKGAWIAADIPQYNAACILVVPASYPSEMISASFRFNGAQSNPVLLQAAKLERGIYSTLANDPVPNFGGARRKCQERLLRVSPMGTSSRGYAGFGSANSSKNILVFVPTPVTLAAQPTVSFSNCNAYNYVTGGSIAISSISIDSWTQNGVFLSCTPSDTSQVVQYQPYVLRVASGGFLDLSCEP